MDFLGPCAHGALLLSVSAVAILAFSKIAPLQFDMLSAASLLGAGGAVPLLMCLSTYVLPSATGHLSTASSSDDTRFGAGIHGCVLCLVLTIGAMSHLQSLVWEAARADWLHSEVGGAREPVAGEPNYDDELPAGARRASPWLRRQLLCSVAACSLALGCERVRRFPDGLLAPLAAYSGLQWWAHWAVSSTIGCLPLVSLLVCYDPVVCMLGKSARWRPAWAAWSLPHRQYLLFLALLMAPTMRVSAHFGAIFSDAGTPQSREPVGLCSLLLAVGVLLVASRGLDFRHDYLKARFEATAQHVPRRAREQVLDDYGRWVPEYDEYDDEYDGVSEVGSEDEGE